MPLSVGDQLGPYEILGPLGAGSMGEVYRGRDTRLGRDIAIKVLPPMDHILSIVLFTPLAGLLVLLAIPSSNARA
jgi:serine/threonine protein kinase